MKCAFESVLQEAGTLMRSYQTLHVQDKGGHANFVTEADMAVQSFLVEELTRQFPHACFLAEEQDNAPLTDAFTFIIDPIDGTTNYFRGRNSSVISVGAVENGVPVLGAIYDPYRDMLFYAEAGRGAYRGEERLTVSDMPLNQALIEWGSAPYYEELFERTGRTVSQLLPRIADFRRSGSAALDLTHVAEGVSDGMFEWMLQPWDYCAGALLVQEAGGRYGAIFGGAPSFEKGTPFIAANAKCFDALQELLQKMA